jgi:exosortase
MSKYRPNRPDRIRKPDEHGEKRAEPRSSSREAKSKSAPRRSRPAEVHSPKEPPKPQPIPVAVWVIALGSLAGVAAWSYWPTIVAMVQAWMNEADYSHGVFVPPLAALFLWTRRATFPKQTLSFSMVGFLLVVGALVFRTAGTIAFVDAIDGWSMIVLVGAFLWMLGGWEFFLWCLPAVGFLLFMVPLPFRVEHLLSLPLQTAATEISAWLLQLLGQPAIVEGRTIHLNEHHLEVAQACSGLRMFLGIVALAYAFCVLSKRPWWQKVMLGVAVLPIAMISNAARITATGLLYQFVSTDAGQKFSHDVAGWAMIVFAAMLMGLFLYYLKHLFIEIRPAQRAELLKRGLEGAV